MIIAWEDGEAEVAIVARWLQPSWEVATVASAPYLLLWQSSGLLNSVDYRLSVPAEIMVEELE
jgi:hypothetical protein